MPTISLPPLRLPRKYRQVLEASDAPENSARSAVTQEVGLKIGPESGSGAAKNHDPRACSTTAAATEAVRQRDNAPASSAEVNW